VRHMGTLECAAAKSKSKIVCVIPSLGCGGAERVMVSLTRGLAHQGYGITLLTLSQVDSDFFSVEPPVVRVTLPGDVELSCRWFDVCCQRKRISALRQAILTEEPDIVISFLDTTNVAVLMALSDTGIPVIVSEHTDPRHHPIGWRWNLLRRCYYPLAKRVVMLTQETMAWASNQWPRWRATAIPNPVYMTLPPITPARPEFLASRTLITLGRLQAVKGHDVLINAFSAIAERFPEWTLVICGEGPERPRLERQVAELGLYNRVSLPGRVAEVSTVLMHADIFVMSSRYEGFPMAVLEAMVAGLPVISFACNGPPDIIRDGTDGLLVPPMDVEALSAAMASLMGDASERQRLAAKAPEVSERFSEQRVLALWEDMIEDILDHG
jgi:GalNAc-alpha-(1->4)-GalNAc-alpha-(1->3)-diNAcBac-PP-undecaprenol alpha-1,4-N-acetyl-D-galactosaminyltransferase